MDSMEIDEAEERSPKQPESVVNSKQPSLFSLSLGGWGCWGGGNFTVISMVSSMKLKACKIHTWCIACESYSIAGINPFFELNTLCGQNMDSLYLFNM